MPIHQAILLAVIQGLTEFLPISSSAHLALVPWLLGWKDQGLAFDIALHFGTLLAVLIYFARDWYRIVRAGLGLGPDEGELPRHLLWMLAAATVPVGVAGLLLKDAAETVFRTPWVIGTMLILVGLLMAWAERRAQLGRHIRSVTWTDAMAVGAAQALAVVPGTSRSGITLVAGLFRGFDRASAARFSFLVGTPAIAAAAADAFLDLYRAGGVPPGERGVFFSAMAVSAATGCAVIAWFLRFLRQRTLKFFVAYRIVLGILILALAFFRRLAG
ncbi:MAG: undecaprenyl-diphosphatase UppP [Bryobacteraceae bacterium]|nr:undecaprenyl-diphosphatase UppP [Bryobacteraceae bacterium]MCX7602529.1 undecaprenyl-diphosphatase UppP [Bryobacteraceae bacterium]